jgi:hypothetical protein
MANLLDRKNLLKKEVFGIEKVDFGEEGFVYVRQMSARERDRFEQSLILETKDSKGTITGYTKSLEDFRAKLAVVTICDESGNNLLNPEDYVMLSTNMTASKMEKIVNVAQKLNKITEEDKEALVKNSDAAPDGSSNSGSVENLE